MKSFQLILSLFLRLVIAIERNPNPVVEDYFSYELTPYPTSLLKNGLMRSATNKSSLKNHIVSSVTPKNSISGLTAADGGVLSWNCNWNKNETFDMLRKYTGRSRHLKTNVVVFDGYAPSTKDGTHISRSKKVSQAVNIDLNKHCPSDRNGFLLNTGNKESLIRFLKEKLEEMNIKLILRPSDADTTIVQTALDIAEASTVTVLADDTDIFCLLLYHCYVNKNLENEIFLRNMRTQKNTDERVSYSIQDVMKSCGETCIKWILFSHAFCGCVTTSSIFNLGKTTMLEKLKKIPNFNQSLIISMRER